MTITRTVRAASALAAALIVTTALVTPSFAATGKAADVAFANGDVRARADAGGQRAVAKGAVVDGGDTILTTDGRTQLNFSDGGFMSIYENSEMRVDSYFFGQDDTPPSAAFTLLQGGIRVVSGAIAKSDTTRYLLDTPVGQLGVRGTGYTAVMDGSLTVTVGEGAVMLTNQAGSLLLNTGETGFIRDAATAPVRVDGRAYLPPPAPPRRAEAPAAQPLPFSAVEQRTAEGGLAILASNHDHPTIYEPSTPTTPTTDTPTTDTPTTDTPTTPTTPTTGSVSAPLGTGPYTIAYAADALGLDTRTGTTATQAADGQLDAYTASAEESLGRGSNSSSELYGDQYITLGRWSGGTTSGTYYSMPAQTRSATQGFHYAIGVPTATMPTTGTASYALLGATTPTFGNGTGGPGTFTGSMAVAFGATPQVGYELTVDMPGDAAYALSSSGGVASPSISVENGTFYGTTHLPDTGRACTGAGGACMGSVNGFFAGPDAARIGLSYMVWWGTGGGADTIEGAAVFGRQ